MSYRTVSSKRPYGDEWVQMQCDGCGALGPRVEVTLPRRGPMHEAKRESVLKLAKQFAGFTERLRPWRTASGRLGKGQVVDDMCRTCIINARLGCLVEKLIERFGPFGPVADTETP